MFSLFGDVDAVVYFGLIVFVCWCAVRFSLLGDVDALVYVGLIVLVC